MADMTHKQVAEAVAAIGGVTVVAMGLRFDRVAVRVLDRLQRNADAEPRTAVSVALTLTAPVRSPCKTAAALQQEIGALLRRAVLGTGGGSSYKEIGPTCVSSRASRRGGQACLASSTTLTSTRRRSWPLRNGGSGPPGKCRLVGARLMSAQGGARAGCPPFRTGSVAPERTRCSAVVGRRRSRSSRPQPDAGHGRGNVHWRVTARAHGPKPPS